MQVNCDGVVHNPLGGASYVFEKEIIPYILGSLHKNKLKISVGAQPNSSPHFGTLETIALAFALARKIEEYDSKKKVTILYEVIENAPSETVVIDGVKYQRSLNFTGKIDTYFAEYLEILNHYKKLTGIDYEIRYQYEFNEQPETLEVFKTVLKNREYVAKKLDQKLQFKDYFIWKYRVIFIFMYKILYIQYNIYNCFPKIKKTWFWEMKLI